MRLQTQNSSINSVITAVGNQSECRNHFKTDIINNETQNGELNDSDTNFDIKRSIFVQIVVEC